MTGYEDHQDWQPRLHGLRAPLPYGIARKIADMSLQSRLVRVGPRVVDALLTEIDASNRQVSNLVDAFAHTGDGLMLCHRERNEAREEAAVARAEAALHFDMVQRLGIENQRLRDRLAAQHREANS